MAFIIKPGISVVIPSPPSDIKHPWIALTYPSELPAKIARVNLTSFRDGSDTTVVFEPGDHPWIRHRTIVYYAQAKVSRAASFKTVGESGQYEVVDFLSLMDRILEGLSISPHTPPDVLRFCNENQV
ncbi:MAG: hypothetical protein O7G87_12510 [bacterium]|nr:hypothetical protein [bacterium]